MAKSLSKGDLGLGHWNLAEKFEKAEPEAAT